LRVFAIITEPFDAVKFDDVSRIIRGELRELMATAANKLTKKECWHTHKLNEYGFTGRKRLHSGIRGPVSFT